MKGQIIVNLLKDKLFVKRQIICRRTNFLDLIGLGHWHLVNNRLDSYIYHKNKIRFSQNKVNKRDMVMQNIFSYITKSFYNRNFTRFSRQEGHCSIIISLILPKGQTTFFKSFTILRKFKLTFHFCPFSCLGENNSHLWRPVREVTNARSAKNAFCLLTMSLCKFRKE